MPTSRYVIEEFVDGEWRYLSHRSAYDYKDPIRRFDSHDRAKGEALGVLAWPAENPLRVLAPDGSILSETTN